MADEEFLPVTAGDPITVQLEFTEPADPDQPEGAKVAKDMSAWTFASQWRPTESSTRVLNFAVDDSRADEGVLLFTLTGAQTATMLQDGVYDIEGVNGEPRTFWKERTVLTLDVTRG